MDTAAATRSSTLADSAGSERGAVQYMSTGLLSVDEKLARVPLHIVFQRDTPVPDEVKCPTPASMRNHVASIDEFTGKIVRRCVLPAW